MKGVSPSQAIPPRPFKGLPPCWALAGPGGSHFACRGLVPSFPQKEEEERAERGKREGAWAAGELA